MAVNFEAISGHLLLSQHQLLNVLINLNLLKSEHCNHVINESFNTQSWIFGVMTSNVCVQLSLGSNSQQLKPNMHLSYKLE